MKLGIFAKTFLGNSPHDVMKAAADAGYVSVQYNMACSGIGSLPECIEPQTSEAIRHAALETGVAIAAISATYNMTHPNLKARVAGRRAFEAIASQAKLIGSNLLTVCSGSLDANDQWRHHPDNASPAAWDDMLNEFSGLIEIARRHDIYIGVEPELANIVNGARKARTMIDTLGSDRIRIVLDPANLIEAETANERLRIIEEAVDLLGDCIVMAHAKDRNADGSFATAGRGVIDFAHFIDCLTRAGFNGSLVTHGLHAEEAPDVARFLSDILVTQGGLT
jgi:sugar phosphate isomerase/epimerase